MDGKRLKVFMELVSRRAFSDAAVLLDEAEQAGAVAPTSLHYHRGFLQRAAGDLLGAEHHYRAALRLDPQLVAAWHGLGISLQLQQRFAEAVDAFETGLCLAPAHLATLNSLALTHKLAGHLERALVLYQEAQATLVSEVFDTLRKEHEGNPAFIDDSDRTTLMLGAQYLELSRQALVEDGRYKIIMNNIGQCLVALGRTDQARAALVESISFIGDDETYDDPRVSLAALERDAV